MGHTPSLTELYNAYTEIDGFRHYIGKDEWDDSTLVYAIGVDTSHLDECDRVKDRIRDEYGIPNKVVWNGDTYTLHVQVFSIRSNSVKTYEMSQVHDRGYPDKYDFISFEIGEAFRNSDEWSLSTSASGRRCNDCGTRINVDTPKGGVVTPAGESVFENSTPWYCVPCGLKKIGREDILE